MENNDRFGSGAQNPSQQRQAWNQPGQRPVAGGFAGAPAQATGQRASAPNASGAQQVRAGSPQQGLAQEVEQLAREREQINLDRARAQTEKERSSDDWDKLSAELREQFGTDDLDEIEQRLNETDAENERKVASFRAALAQSREETQEALRRQEEARRL